MYLVLWNRADESHPPSAPGHDDNATSARVALRLMPSLKKEGPETAFAHVIVDL